MSLPFEDHPELEKLFEELEEGFQQTENGERAGIVSSFRADVNLKMQRAGIAINDAWMFFRSYRSNDEFPDLPDPIKVDTFVIRQVRDVRAGNGGMAKAPYIRVFEIEEFASLSGWEHIVRDCLLDQEGHSQCLTDLTYVGPTATEEQGVSELAKSKIADLTGTVPFLPLPQIDRDGKMAIYYHHLELLVPLGCIPRDPNRPKAGSVVPYGWHSSNPLDYRHSLSEIVRIFENIKHLEPDHTGELIVGF